MAPPGARPYIEGCLPCPALTQKNWLISGALVLLCGGILVLFTDVEIGLVRWFNCGPLGGEAERNSAVCRATGR